MATRVRFLDDSVIVKRIEALASQGFVGSWGPWALGIADLAGTFAALAAVTPIDFSGQWDGRRPAKR